MLSLVYTNGTVTVSSGSAVVTGSDTGWALARVVGGAFSALGRSIPIISVESDTSLTLAYPWPGPNYSGAYAISRPGSEAAENVFAYQTLTEVLRRGFMASIPIVGLGTLTERDALDPTPDVGSAWLRWEDGQELAYYFKEDDGWDGPYPVRGAAGSAGGVAGGLNDLSDVSLTTPTDGDGLVRDGGVFVNKPVAVTSGVSNIMKIEQSAYDALDPPDDATLYLIMEDEE